MPNIKFMLNHESYYFPWAVVVNSSIAIDCTRFWSACVVEWKKNEILYQRDIVLNLSSGIC